MAKPKTANDYLNKAEEDLRHLDLNEWLEWLHELRSEVEIRIETVSKEVNAE